MAYDGIQFGGRVDNFGNRNLHRKVVDNVLSSRTYMSRLMGMGRRFEGKTMDFTVKVTDSGLGEFFTGLETLNTSASDTTITLSYAQTAFTQPVVSIMLESFANADQYGIISLDKYKMEEAMGEATQKLGTALYGTGIGNQPLGLEALVDDGTNASTIGGQSRTTYTNLKGIVTPSGGTLSLNKLATLEDSISASGLDTETPNVNLTTKTIWSLYEQLLSPQVRAEYASIGYPQLSMRGDTISKSRAELKGNAGFTVLTFRGNPVIKDDACTSGVWYMLNERYLFWAGRTEVPENYKDFIEKIDLKGGQVTEGVMAELDVPTSYGWFFQKRLMLPNQAGQVGRYYVIGQTMTDQPRRHGKLTSISSI